MKILKGANPQTVILTKKTTGDELIWMLQIYWSENNQPSKDSVIGIKVGIYERMGL